MKNPKRTDVVPLSTLIAGIKADLRDSALQKKAEERPMFHIDEVTVEIAVGFERAVAANGQVDIAVVALGAEGTETSNVTHKVILKLSPFKDKTGRWPGDDESLVRGARRKHKG
jgi:hypothetical protein